MLDALRRYSRLDRGSAGLSWVNARTADQPEATIDRSHGRGGIFLRLFVTASVRCGRLENPFLRATNHAELPRLTFRNGALNVTIKVDLDEDEAKQADEYENVPVTVVFEAIRRDGEDELSRGFSALWWSGIAAGLAISTSVLCKGFLASILPQADWAAGISNLGYTVGFLIVILGRMQLFTENTITPILPLFLEPNGAKFYQIARLWGIVFTANLVGCATAALVLVYGRILPEARFEGVLAVSRHYMPKRPRSSISPGGCQPGSSSPRSSGSCRGWRARGRC